jgi:hypothetical protein
VEYSLRLFQEHNNQPIGNIDLAGVVGPKKLRRSTEYDFPGTLDAAAHIRTLPGQLAELAVVLGLALETVAAVGQWHVAPSDQRHLHAYSFSPAPVRGWPLSAPPGSRFCEVHLLVVTQSSSRCVPVRGQIGESCSLVVEPL